MFTGKKRCKILKEIRRQIAVNNDIEFVTSECKHQGDCLGTCPKCEAEVRYLERELEKRMKLGKAVAVAGLAVALTTSTVGCDELFDGLRPTGGDPLPPEGYDQPAGGIEAPTTGDIVEAGEIPVPDEGTDEGELGGEPLPNDNYEIEGDMPG
jgi:hypothetical protein